MDGRPTLPEGRITFVFTDIEGSTRQAQALGDEVWADVLHAHRALLRTAFAANRGVEVGTDGDAFFVAFADPVDAVRASSDGQRAIEGHPWPDGVTVRVRAGIHTGDALVRHGDYVGHAVHAAKRVSDAGHGGQVVLSATTEEAVRANGTEGFRTRDLGLHRLKDLDGPQRLFQLVVDGLQADFPPLRSLSTSRHDLPLQRSPLIGRRAEQRAVEEQLDKGRLVTLTGIGGCGKTRLALHIGAELADAFADGVAFVDLAAVADPIELPGATANAIGLPPTRGQVAGDISAQVLEHLALHPCLLIVDNCEHLLDDTAAFVEAVLDRCPDVRVLATSREALGVDDERLVQVPSLALPEGDGVDEVAGAEAVELFVERARAVSPGFELTADNAGAVAEICRRLDGIPLAIELAAARVSHLSARQVADRLDDMFRLLTGSRRRVQRQQTLQATLDWSYDLLSDADQILLDRLGVFPGSFGLAAAEAICSGEGVPPDAVVDGLGSLVTKSLVTTVAAPTELRYRLLESVRLYAEDKLRRRGESDVVRARHCDHHVAWLASFDRVEAWLDASLYELLERDMANIRAALRWAAATRRQADLATSVSQVGSYWANIGALDDLDEWTTKVIDDPTGVSTERLVDCLGLRGYAAMGRDEERAVADARRAVEVADGVPSMGLAFALMELSFNLSVQAELTGSAELAAEVRRLSDSALAQAEPLGVPAVEIFAANYRSMAELVLGDLEAALEYGERALRRAADGGHVHTVATDPIYLAQATSRCAVILHLLGRDAEAARVARQTDALREGGARVRWSATQANQVFSGVAVPLAAVGEADSARAAAREQIRSAHDSRDPLLLNDALITAAAVAFLCGPGPEVAARLLAAARAVGTSGGTTDAGFGAAMGYALYRRYLSLVREALPSDVARRCRAEGLALTADTAVDAALTALVPGSRPGST